MRRILAGAAVMAALVLSADAVGVRPIALWLDRQGSGEIILTTGAYAEAVSIRALYLIPLTDERGIIRLGQPDTLTNDLTPHLLIYPDSLTIPPESKRTVRLLARDLPRGESWTRLLIRSRVLRGTPESVQGVVSAGVSIGLTTVIAITARRGRVETGLTADVVAADSLGFWLHLKREGNGTWIGRANYSIGGQEWSVPYAVYTEIRPRVMFPRPLEPGTHELRILFDQERPDLQHAPLNPCDDIVIYYSFSVD